MAPSGIVAWECGSCTYTNEGNEPGPCIMCRTERPIRYAIVAGAPTAATARTTTVNRREQARVAASAARAADARTVTAVDATAPAADAGEAAAIARPLMPVAGTQNRDTVVARLVSTLVDIVGTGASNRGRSCVCHETCGMQVEVGTKVMFRWEKVVYRDQEEEDAVAVFLVANGRMSCKVGFLPAHLARRAQDYDGLVARVICVYSDRCTNVVKRQKFWRNKGCCVARILGSRPILSL
jgi:hypothetical protein